MPHADPATRRTYHAQWKRRNRAKYRDRQKATDAARHANGRALKYGAVGLITIDEAAQILTTKQCHYCGLGGPTWLGLDHVQSLWSGGVNRPENIVVACHSCNASKFRGDQPRRWSRLHECCVACGTTDRDHLAHGLCKRCHAADRYRRTRIKQ